MAVTAAKRLAVEERLRAAAAAQNKVEEERLQAELQPFAGGGGLAADGNCSIEVGGGGRAAGCSCNPVDGGAGKAED